MEVQAIMKDTSWYVCKIDVIKSVGNGNDVVCIDSLRT